MPTCRLSDVITGWGGKEMTCSRRSMVARTRSTNGTRMDRPGDSVRLYRPSRSITFAWACGTMVTLLASTMTTKSATTSRAMSAGVTGAPFLGYCRSCSLRAAWSRVIHRVHPCDVDFRASFQGVADDRGRAVHLKDPHGGADGEGLA